MNATTKIALSNNKKNKTRSILIIIAILLTTSLLTIISTFANGFVRLQKKNASNHYGSNYGLFLSVNNQQLQEIYRRAEIDDIGIMSAAGILKGNEKGSFVSTDSSVRKMLPYNKEYLLEAGAYPEKENEIAGSKAFFESQGYNDVQVGDEIKLYYRSGMSEEYTERSFVISGILYNRENYQISSSYVVFCSPAFYENEISNDYKQYNVYFTLNDSVKVSMNNIDDVLTSIAKSCGINSNNLIINSYYLSWMLDPSYEMILFCGFTSLIIILLAVIVIYNIFQVGIAQKIQEYGKIKALGATKKQMKYLILKEGLILSVIAIPLGLIIGFFIAKLSFSWLIEQGNLLETSVKNIQVPLFSIPLMLITIIISLLTVILALRKPMKIVARISPIEATRYLENSTIKNCGIRKGKKNITVFSMAMANILGNKKRTLTTILTMGLSCVLFVIISNFVRNIDTEYEARKGLNHGQFELKLDYSLEWDEAYPENNLDSILKNNPLNESLIAKIKAIPEVKDVITREIAVVNIDDVKQVISIVNKNDFENMRFEDDLGLMDYDEAVKNKDIFFGWSMWMEPDGYSLNDLISLQIDNGTEILNYQGNILGAFVSSDTYLVMPEEVYNSLHPSGSSFGYLWVDCDKNNVSVVENQLRDLIENTSYIKLKTYHDELAMTEFTSTMMKLGSYLFVGILGLIGFMNLANTIIINIITKKQEYGVLQAVGMTNKQLNLSLQIQGLIFTIGSIFVSLIVGLPLGYMLFSFAKRKGIFGMNIYHIPITPILVMIAIILILQIILSFTLSHNFKKETLVERIRYQV